MRSGVKKMGSYRYQGKDSAGLAMLVKTLRLDFDLIQPSVELLCIKLMRLDHMLHETLTSLRSENDFFVHRADGQNKPMAQ